MAEAKVYYYVRDSGEIGGRIPESRLRELLDVSLAPVDSDESGALSGFTCSVCIELSDSDVGLPSPDSST